MNLHEIYPLEKIVEYSFYQFILYLSLFILLVYIGIRYYQKRKKRPLLPLEILEISDHSRAKEMAFKLSYYGEGIAKTAEQEVLFRQLKKKLTPFKYIYKDAILHQSIQDEIQNFLTSMR